MNLAPIFVDAQILDQDYRLTCDPHQELALRQAIDRVHNAMSTLQQAGRIRSRERMAIVTAINLALELIETQSPPSETGTGSLSRHATPSVPLTDRDLRLQRLIDRLDYILSTSQPPWPERVTPAHGLPPETAGESHSSDPR